MTIRRVEIGRQATVAPCRYRPGRPSDRVAAVTEHGGHPPLSHIWSSDQSLYARLRQMIAHPSSVKLIKYAFVSVISTVVSQVTLILVFGVFHLMSEVPANVVANVLATVPSYVLNRRWVWGKSGKSHFWKEVAPFWILSFVGLAFSSLAVWLAGDFARRTACATAQPRSW